MTVSLAWRNSIASTDASLFDTEPCEETGFASRCLPITLVARLQIDYRPSPSIGLDQFGRAVAADPVPKNALIAFIEHLTSDCRAGLLRMEKIPYRPDTPSFEVEAVPAEAFAEWLRTNGMQPSAHIQAWFDEAGVSFGKTTAPEEKSLATRERNTLLAIIAALCKEANIDHTRPSKAAGMIQHTAIGMGLQIGETTIERHLKKIPDALESRMK